MTDPKFLLIFLLQQNHQEKIIRTQKKEQKHNKTKQTNKTPVTTCISYH